MNGNKSDDSKLPSQTYKPVSEKAMEDAVSRSKNESKYKFNEEDGADEKMLPKEDNKVSEKSDIALKDVKIMMSEKNGDAKIDSDQKNSFGGMSKEELMKYVNDPFWIRLRWFLFVSFWLLWAAMLVGAIMIIYAAPKCDPPPPRTWWQVGPLAEVEENLNPDELTASKHLKGLIISYTEDPYLPVNDSHHVVRLLQKARESGTKVIIGLDPTTSQLWFEDSQNNNSAYLDYYIWQQPKFSAGVAQPPNNWLYLEGNSSWIFSQKRKQYYYAPLLKPHLNFHNQIVVNEFAQVIKKFMEYGASGFRIKNAPMLLVDPNFLDETLLTKTPGINVGEPGFFKPSKTRDNEGLGKLLLSWKEVIKNKTEDGLLMIAEQLGKVKSYQVNESLVVDLPLLANIFTKPNVTSIVHKLNESFKVDNVKWPLWKEKSSSLPSDVVNIVTNLLPGTTLIDLNSTADERLMKIRDSPSIMRGNCDMYAISNNSVFAFVREIAGNPGVLVALNTADERASINIKEDIPTLSSLEEVTVQYYSQNYNETEFMDIGSKKEVTKITLSPKSVLVLQYVPKKK